MLMAGATRAARPLLYQVNLLGWYAPLLKTATRNQFLHPATITTRWLAHGKLLKPKPRPRYTIEEACEMLAEKSKGRRNVTVYEFAVKLNLGPAMPHMKAHKLKGVFVFPHGSGKRPLNVAAFTSDPDLAISAYHVGAKYAGDLGDFVRAKLLDFDKIDRIVATEELIDVLNLKEHRVAKTLRKYKLNPNYAFRTLCKPENFVECVQGHVTGRFHKFVICSPGLIICPLGTITGTTPEQVRANAEYVLRYLYSIQPYNFGMQKHRKKKNIGKYVLGLHLGGSQLPAVPLSLKSLLHDTGIDNTGKYAVEWETE